MGLDINATPFISLCRLLDKLALFKLVKKKALFEQFIRQIPADADLYPVLRLIFPEADSARGAYGLKEHALGRIFSDVMVLPDKETKRLLGWKDPNLQAKHNCTVGDFPSVLLSVIEPRISSDPAKPQTIGQVNEFLDQLYSSTESDARKQLLRELVWKSKPIEIKWIIRMVLKDMKLGLGVESILRHLHPEAIKLYHISSSLDHVLRSIGARGKDETLPVDAGIATSIFFSPFKPMLAQRVEPGDIPEKFASMGGTIFLEPKLDGERMLVHVSKVDEKVRIFSRNGNDFTDKYGPNQLIPLALRGFKGEALVMDGELVSWDSERGRIGPFGTGRNIGVEVSEKFLNNESVALDDAFHAKGNLFYVVFDILFYKDLDGVEYDLRHTSLEDRRELLEKVIVPCPHQLEVVHSTKTSASNVSAIRAFLKKSLDDKLEGIVIKRAHSVYELNVRGGGGWFKVKADYDDTLSDTLDLVVLGGYFGLDVGNVTSFLVGVPKEKEDDATDQSTKKTVFKTLAAVSTGLTVNQLVFVRNYLKDSIVPPGGGTPSWFDGWSPNKNNTPDVVYSPWINPLVFEVKAGEIVYSAEFSAGYTLRFARIVKLRTDKSWADGTSFDDLREMASVDPAKNRIFIQDLKRGNDVMGEENLHEDKIPSSQKRKKIAITPKKGKSVIVTSPSKDAADTDFTYIAPNVKPLANVSVYVINSAVGTSMAKSLGAIVYTKYTPGLTNYVIAERDDVRTINAAKVIGQDILNILWLEDCAKNNALVSVEKDRHVLRFAIEKSLTHLN